MKSLLWLVAAVSLIPLCLADEPVVPGSAPEAVPEFPPEIIHMQNGDVYSGYIQGFDVEKNALVMQSEDIGEVKLPWARVSAMESSRDLYFRMENGNIVQGKAAGLEGGKFAILSPLVGKITVQHDQILMIAPTAAGISPEFTDLQKKFADSEEALRKATELGELWSGYLNANFSGNEGNKNDRTFGASAHLERKTEFDRFTAHIDIRYVEARRERTTNQVEGFLKEDIDMTERLYLWGQLSGLWDEIKGIDLRFRAELGLGLHLLKPGDADIFGGDEISLRWEVGAQFTNTDYETSEDTHTGGIVTRIIYQQSFTLPVSWLKGPKPWLLEIGGEYYQSMVKPQNKNNADSLDEYSLKGWIYLTIPFTEFFHFSARVWDEYSNVTDTADQRRNDFYWDLGLGVNF